MAPAACMASANRPRKIQAVQVLRLECEKNAGSHKVASWMSVMPSPIVLGGG